MCVCADVSAAAARCGGKWWGGLISDQIIRFAIVAAAAVRGIRQIKVGARGSLIFMRGPGSGRGA